MTVPSRMNNARRNSLDADVTASAAFAGLASSTRAAAVMAVVSMPDQKPASDPETAAPRKNVR